MVKSVLMGLRGVLKSAAPAIVTEIVRSHRQLKDAHPSHSVHSWFAALSPRVRRAIEASRFPLYPRWLRRGLSFVVDFGANEGQWITSLLTLLPVKEVWIFEPNPDAMQRCRVRVGESPRAVFHEIALGAGSGKAVLHITKSSDFSSLLHPNTSLIETNYRNHPAQVVAERTVEVSTLDEIVPKSKKIDLLKIDVQGVERDVVLGGNRTLRRTAAILLEVNLRSHYHGDQTFGPLYSLFESQNFELWSLSCPYLGSSGEALWADALFVNRTFETDNAVR